MGSGSGLRCQDTILGDVDAQTRFEITSKQSNDPPLSRVNPIIYTSCIEQFWATAKVQTVNRVRQLQALVDKKRVIVTESSIRRDLYLDDAEGTDYLPTAIFEELARMGFNLSKYIFDAMVKHLDVGVKFLMYPCFLQVFINQQLGNMSTHKKIFVNPFHTKKVFANMKQAGKDFSGRITPLFDTMIVQASEEVEVPQDETEHEESVPTPSNDPQPSGEDSMQLTDLIVLCTKLQTQVLDLEKAKDAQAKEIAALKKRIQRLERKKKSRHTGLKRLKKVDEEKGKLFMELMEKRRKHFAALRAQEKRNRPPTKAQKRTQMSTYLKHMEEYTYKQLKGKSFDEIQKLFDKENEEVEVSDKVMLEVSSWKDVVHLEKKEMLAPIYKYLADTNLYVHLEEIKVNKTLHFVKKPIEIMDRKVKTLKPSRILIVKSIGTQSEVSEVVHNGNYAKCVAGEKITTADYNCLKNFYCQEDKDELKR
ncbi:hypothetical protein Tco_0488758 [Tanacetum coccineum]